MLLMKGETSPETRRADWEQINVGRGCIFLVINYIIAIKLFPLLHSKRGFGPMVSPITSVDIHVMRTEFVLR